MDYLSSSSDLRKHSERKFLNTPCIFLLKYIWQKARDDKKYLTIEGVYVGTFGIGNHKVPITNQPC